tara:strand:- start:4632 stop:4739 length:108 start_codon:yes stop_codon:yes gene_type:complete
MNEAIPLPMLRLLLYTIKYLRSHNQEAPGVNEKAP